MATTARRRTTKATGTRATNTGARKATPAKRAAAKATPAKAAKDVTQYAEKEPTDYHRTFARWIVSEVGYDPNSAASKKAAFLAGVSIATAARPAFMDSEFLEEWREKTGVAKRGPKPKEEAETTRRKTRQVVSDDEFEDDEDEEDTEEIDEDDDFEDEDDSDEFDEDEDSEDDSDEDEDDEEFEEEDEEEEAPPARSRRAPAKKAAPAKRTAAKKATPAKRTRGKDDDFLF